MKNFLKSIFAFLIVFSLFFGVWLGFYHLCPELVSGSSERSLVGFLMAMASVVLFMLALNS